MILIDTSAWVEFLRDTGSATCSAVDGLIASEIAICGVVRMEVLAGARDSSHLLGMRPLLARATMLHTQPIDYDYAAELYLNCRRQGRTVRKMIDCLIASIAVRNDTPILHNDRDFDTLILHTDLQVYDV